MSHRAAVVWVPAEQAHRIVCLDCGATLVNDVEAMPEFEYPGECEPGEILGISVKEMINVKDIFGNR